jgi:hypothetical protein
VLTDTDAKHAKAKATPRKLADREGLYLYVGAKSGSGKPARSWRYDYRLNGRRETLTLGRYPELSLAYHRRFVADTSVPDTASNRTRVAHWPHEVQSVRSALERPEGCYPRCLCAVLLLTDLCRSITPSTIPSSGFLKGSG